MLIDSYDRKVDYLRISVTQRCNFRCQYCMPEKPFEWVPKEDLLSYEELFDFIKLSIDNGVKKIRITGGEPTVRDDLDRFIAMINNYDPSVDLALTTNGFLLKYQARKLYDAGLQRLNISLDSLDPKQFFYLTKKDALDHVLEGIDRALEVGLKIKLNTVVMQGINQGEILTLYRYAKKKNIEIRFIEFMENESANRELKSVSSDTILQHIATQYMVTPLANKTASASKPYIDEDGYIFGIIEPYDDSFCKTCNRIRLSAQGDIIPCLYYEDSQNIKSSLHSKQKLQKLLFDVVKNKPEKNRWSYNTKEFETSARAFYYTGG